MEQRIGECSACGGDVYGYVGPYMSIVPPPPPKCRACGAVAADCNPVIPMRRPRRIYSDAMTDTRTFRPRQDGKVS